MSSTWGQENLAKCKFRNGSWGCCGWQCSSVMPKFYRWKLLDYPNWYFAHMLKEHFIDVWGQQWFEGDYFIQGFGMRNHVQVVGPI